jgi:hypothetical protein
MVAVSTLTTWHTIFILGSMSSQMTAPDVSLDDSQMTNQVTTPDGNTDDSLADKKS